MGLKPVRLRSNLFARSSPMNHALEQAVPKFKVALIGDDHSGKTAIVNRWVYDNFEEAYSQTVGMDCLSKPVDCVDG